METFSAAQACLTHFMVFLRQSWQATCLTFVHVNCPSRGFFRLSCSKRRSILGTLKVILTSLVGCSLISPAPQLVLSAWRRIQAYHALSMRHQRLVPRLHRPFRYLCDYLAVPKIRSARLRLRKSNSGNADCRKKMTSVHHHSTSLVQTMRRPNQRKNTVKNTKPRTDRERIQ